MCIYVNLTQLEMANLFMVIGIRKEYADMLALMDVQIAKGMEETLDNTVLSITGRRPIKFSAIVHRSCNVGTASYMYIYLVFFFW